LILENHVKRLNCTIDNIFRRLFLFNASVAASRIGAAYKNVADELMSDSSTHHQHAAAQKCYDLFKSSLLYTIFYYLIYPLRLLRSYIDVSSSRFYSKL
jgi:hypothetical protein